jgi:hypothetical protein
VGEPVVQQVVERRGCRPTNDSARVAWTAAVAPERLVERRSRGGFGGVAAEVVEPAPAVAVAHGALDARVPAHAPRRAPALVHPGQSLTAHRPDRQTSATPRPRSSRPMAAARLPGPGRRWAEPARGRPRRARRHQQLVIVGVWRTEATTRQRHRSLVERVSGRRPADPAAAPHGGVLGNRCGTSGRAAVGDAVKSD